jgi:hypothetical protein
LPLRAVICVARTSGRREQDFIERLHLNNQKLYCYFQEKLHAEFHECSSGDCIAEFSSIVFNGYSSNTSIKLPGSNQRPEQALGQLSDVLQTLAAEPSAFAAALMISEEDGFFTNVAAMRSFFSGYSTVAITLFVYKGHDRFDRYQLSQILNAIDDISARHRIDTPAHRLVLSWVEVSLNKEVIAQASRANKEIMPRSRNTIGTFEPAPVNVVTRAYTKSDISQRLQDIAEIRPNDRVRSIIRYELDKLDDAWICPESACIDQFATFDDLVKHLVHQTRKVRCCVLCPPDQFTDMNCESHIRSHLPPALKCPVPACPFITRTPRCLRQHAVTHGLAAPRPNNYKCGFDDCKYAFPSQRDLDRHISRSHIKSEDILECGKCGKKLTGQKGLDNHLQHHCQATDVVHICRECQRSFDRYDSLKQHIQAAHIRRDQVVGFALQAGLIDSNAGILSGVGFALKKT